MFSGCMSRRCPAAKTITRRSTHLGPTSANSRDAVTPPQLSAEELRASEAEASYTVQHWVATAVALYLCMIFTRLPLHSACDLILENNTLTLAHLQSPFRNRCCLQDLLSDSISTRIIRTFSQVCTILGQRYDTTITSRNEVSRGRRRRHQLHLAYRRI